MGHEALFQKLGVAFDGDLRQLEHHERVPPARPRHGEGAKPGARCVPASPLHRRCEIEYRTTHMCFALSAGLADEIEKAARDKLGISQHTSRDAIVFWCTAGVVVAVLLCGLCICATCARLQRATDEVRQQACVQHCKDLPPASRSAGEHDHLVRCGGGCGALDASGARKHSVREQHGLPTGRPRAIAQRKSLSERSRRKNPADTSGREEQGCARDHADTILFLSTV
eukprot:1341648-Prymnesium_polylepis.1